MTITCWVVETTNFRFSAFSLTVAILFGWHFENGRREARYREARYHDDVIKWKHFPRYWPFVMGIHQSPMDFPHKDQWRGASIFSLICASTNGCANNRDADGLRRHRVYYDVIVMRSHDPQHFTADILIVMNKCLRVQSFVSAKFRPHWGMGP